MPIVSQGNSTVVQVGPTDGLWIKSTGVAEVTVSDAFAGSPEVFNVTTDVLRVGFYGEDVSVTVRAVSGQADYQNTPDKIYPLTSVQGGQRADSSPLDISQTVNQLIAAANLSKNQPSSQYWINTNANLWDGSSSLLRDKSLSSNDGKLGANLTSAQLLANAGFLTTVDPGAGVTDSGLRFPPMQYDYAGGESLIVFWKGIITPEGSNQFFLGDTVSSTTQGIAFRVDTAGTCTFMIGNASGGIFSGNSSKVVFDGNLHSFGFLLNAVDKTVQWYVDGEPVTERPFSFAAGVVRDSRAKTTFNIGSVSPAPGTTAGIATRTQALQIFRKYGSINTATAYQIINQLHINPAQIITQEF